VKQIRRERTVAEPSRVIDAAIETKHARSASRLSALFCLLFLLVSGIPKAAAATGKNVPTHVLTPHLVPLAHPFKRSPQQVAQDKARYQAARSGQPLPAVAKNPSAPTSQFNRLIRPQLEALAKKNAGAATASAVTAKRALATGTPSRNFGRFLAAPSYQAMALPNDGNNGVVITLLADFNKDGSQDIVTLDLNGEIAALLNDGKGHFAAPIFSNVPNPDPNVYPGHSVTATAVDVDGDGYPDIVAKQWVFNLQLTHNQTIYIFHNNQDGTFATPTAATTLSVMPSSQEDVGSFLVADVNGDGIPDLVSLASVYTDTDPNNPGNPNPPVFSTITIQTFLGTGGGNFNTTNAPTSTLNYPGYNVGLPSNSVFLQKLDGKVNLVLEAQAYDDVNTGGMALTSVLALPSNGDGTFATASTLEVDFAASYPYITDNTGGLSLADLNGDGTPDITLNFDDDYVYTAMGNADGTFQNPKVADPATFPINPSDSAIVDVNGDGIPDFIDYDGIFTGVWAGNGDGTFANPKFVYSTGSSPTFASQNIPGSNLVVGDFDKDGRVDLAVVDGGNVSYNRASIFIGHGDGSFQAAPAIGPTNDPNTFPSALDAAVQLDLNGDGKTDVLLENFTGSGPYPFVAALSDGFDYKSVAPVTADFNGDGGRDVIFSIENGTAQTLAVSLSNGDGTLKTPVALDLGAQASTCADSINGVSVGDVNGDGKQDIVALCGGLEGPILYGRYTIVPGGYIVALGNGDGTFHQATYSPYGAAPYVTALADLNGDGIQDLILSDDGSSTVTPTVSVIYGDGTGAFDPAKAIPIETGDEVTSILTGDLNHDGKIDLVLLSQGLLDSAGIEPSGQGAQVLINNGAGFDQGAFYEGGTSPVEGVLADFNNDGILDLFYSQYSPTQATGDSYGALLLLGNGDGTFGAPFATQIPPASSILLPGDYLQDGSLDIVTESSYGAVALLLNQGGTSISLSAASPLVTAGENETITASVTPIMAFQPAANGSVTFTENGAVVGSADIVSGQGTLTTAAMTAGPHTLAAAYSGDANLNPNASAGTVKYTVGAAPPPVAPSFLMQASASSIDVTQGQSASAVFTVVANNSFTGKVNFAVSGPLNGLQVQVNPATVTLTPGQSASVSVTVSTLSLKSQTQKPALWRAAGPASLACVFGLLLPFRRRKLSRTLLAIALAAGSLAVMTGLSGCSGSSYTKASIGGSTLVVTATPSVQGVAVQAANLTVSVN
jgi:hypothetical protein